MNQNLKQAIIAFAVTVPILFAVTGMVYAAKKARVIPTFAPQTREAADQENNLIKEKSYTFDDGSFFNISRFEFSEETAARGEYAYQIPLSGSQIEIRWQDYTPNDHRWQITTDPSAAPKATLFLQTDTEGMILSIPALYHNRFDHKTIEALPGRELAAKINKTAQGYEIQMNFEPLPDTIGEFWYYKYPGKMIDWTPFASGIWLVQDLHHTRRFSFDGYYFKTYTSYNPYAENGFFRNPANYTGAHILNNFSSEPVGNLGYAFTMICLENQNEMGFWETGPSSDWLSTDYGIGYDFYDTRFSTDFARSLLKVYNLFSSSEALEGAYKYADFLISFVEEEGYPVGTREDEGILVPDYWGETQQTKTHVSLNHQLAELNFLLELYMATGSTNIQYYNMAKKMLRGIEITCDNWIMPDGNLKYALMYFDSSNTMVDYPYLTYNDLYETKEILAALGEASPEIEKLMAAKKQWMDANGVEGYIQRRQDIEN